MSDKDPELQSIKEKKLVEMMRRTRAQLQSAERIRWQTDNPLRRDLLIRDLKISTDGRGLLGRVVWPL